MMVNSEESSARDRTRWRKELDITRVVSVTAEAYMSAWPVGRTPREGSASNHPAGVAHTRAERRDTHPGAGGPRPAAARARCPPAASARPRARARAGEEA